MSAPSLEPATRACWLEWLDTGLRDGRQGRLAAEYGPLLEDPAVGHVVAESAEGPLSHGLYRSCDVRAGSARWRIGMIGLVYTDPRARGLGLARRCISEAQRAIGRAGGVATLLWGEDVDWYGRQGFHPVGREVFFGVDASVRAKLDAVQSRTWSVDRPRSGDGSRLEALYAQGSSRIERPSGLLEGMAAAPDCTVRVARQAGRVRAYAALGRGDDFRGVVHEWAGDATGALACVNALSAEHGPLAVMTGPMGGDLARALAAAGASQSRESFALARLLDPVGLWQGLGPLAQDVGIAADGEGVSLVGRTDRLSLSSRELLSLVLGSPGDESNEAHDWLRREGAEALLDALPAPLYVWGFDSI